MPCATELNVHIHFNNIQYIGLKFECIMCVECVCSICARMYMSWFHFLIYEKVE